MADKTQKRMAEIRRRYAAGEYQIDLAREYGLTRERVRQIVADLVPQYGHRRWGGAESRRRREMIHELARAGHKTHSIARKVGVSPGTVLYHLGPNVAPWPGRRRSPSKCALRSVGFHLPHELVKRFPRGNRSRFVEKALLEWLKKRMEESTKGREDKPTGAEPSRSHLEQISEEDERRIIEGVVREWRNQGSGGRAGTNRFKHCHVTLPQGLLKSCPYGYRNRLIEEAVREWLEGAGERR